MKIRLCLFVGQKVYKKYHSGGRLQVQIVQRTREHG